MVWRRDRLRYQAGTTRSRSRRQGTGLGKPLKLINHPVLYAIPMRGRGARPRRRLAASSPKAGIPIFTTRKGGLTWDGPLSEGRANRDHPFGRRRLIAAAPVAIAMTWGGDTAAAAYVHLVAFLLRLHRWHGRARQDLLSTTLAALPKRLLVIQFMTPHEVEGQIQVIRSFIVSLPGLQWTEVPSALVLLRKKKKKKDLSRSTSLHGGPLRSTSRRLPGGLPLNAGPRSASSLHPAAFLPLPTSALLRHRGGTSNHRGGSLA